MEGEAHGLLSMPGVGFIGMLIIGIIAGYIAEKVTASDHGLLTNLLVGIAGSFVGGTLAGLLKIEFYGWLGNLIVASVGAEVTELIQGFAIAKTLETTEEELMRTIFPHPTLSEMMHESVLDADGRAIPI